MGCAARYIKLVRLSFTFNMDGSFVEARITWDGNSLFIFRYNVNCFFVFSNSMTAFNGNVGVMILQVTYIHLNEIALFDRPTQRTHVYFLQL